jgi:hypothetical protein
MGQRAREPSSVIPALGIIPRAGVSCAGASRAGAQVCWRLVCALLRCAPAAACPLQSVAPARGWRGGVSRRRFIKAASAAHPHWVSAPKPATSRRPARRAGSDVAPLGASFAGASAFWTGTSSTGKSTHGESVSRPGGYGGALNRPATNRQSAKARKRRTARLRGLRKLRPPRQEAHMRLRGAACSVDE